MSSTTIQSSSSTPQVSSTQQTEATQGKTTHKSSILSKISAKFTEGKNFILNKIKGETGDNLVKIGQIGGVAGMVLGGIALAITGIGSNLTIGGIPLGIPLLVGGALLFLGGTGVLISQLVLSDKTLSNKIKTFFTKTSTHVLQGAALGPALAFSLFSRKNLKQVAVDTGKQILTKTAGHAGENLQNAAKNLVHSDNSDKNITPAPASEPKEVKPSDSKESTVDTKHDIVQKQTAQLSPEMEQKMQEQFLLFMRFFMASYIDTAKASGKQN